MARHRKQRACGKRRFRDIEQAKSALRFINTKGAVREKNPVRAYNCEACKGAHLTSKETWA